MNDVAPWRWGLLVLISVGLGAVCLWLPMHALVAGEMLPFSGHASARPIAGHEYALLASFTLFWSWGLLFAVGGLWTIASVAKGLPLDRVLNQARLLWVLTAYVLSAIALFLAMEIGIGGVYGFVGLPFSYVLCGVFDLNFAAQAAAGDTRTIVLAVSYPCAFFVWWGLASWFLLRSNPPLRVVRARGRISKRILRKRAERKRCRA